MAEVNQTEGNITVVDPETNQQTITEIFQNAIANIPEAFLIIGAVILVTILFFSILLGIYAFIVSRKAKNKEKYDKNPLKDYIREDIKQVLNSSSNPSDRTNQILRYNLDTLGEAYDHTRFNEFEDLSKSIESLKKENYELFGDIDQQDFEELNQDINGDQLVKEGLIDSEEKKNLVENNFIPHRLIAVRPESTLGKIKWIITDQAMDKDLNTKYYLIPEILITDAIDHIQIPRNIQFRNIGGVEMPLYRSSMGILSSIVHRHLFAIALEDLENYSERMNFADPDFSKEFNKMIKELELKDQLGSKGVAGDV